MLGELWRSEASVEFPWLIEGVDFSKKGETHSVSIDDVLAREDLSIDPKRWCSRVVNVQTQLRKGSHFRIGDIADVIPEVAPVKEPSGLFKYVELGSVADGLPMPQTVRGWELPSRARHAANPGDVFIGRIWSSVSTWCVIGAGDSSSMRLSNGFHRLQLKKGKEAHLVDLIAGLNTEAYRIQARAFCTGSDGLADLSDEDVLQIVLPKLEDKSARLAVQERVDALLAGRSTVAAVVEQLVEKKKLGVPDVVPRSSHVVQV